LDKQNEVKNIILSDRRERRISGSFFFSQNFAEIQPALSLPKGRTALLRAAALLRMTGLLLSKTRII